MTKQHAYITTAIPYVNGLPHIGHAMDYMLADVWTRYQRQNGREVRFQTGVDEHGNKIAAKAASQNQTPQAYVDQIGQNENCARISHKRDFGIDEGWPERCVGFSSA